MDAIEMPTFQSPQAATNTAKRLMRLAVVSTVKTVRTSRCANGKYLTAISLFKGARETEYQKIENALTAHGFTVRVYRDTEWVSATSLMPKG